MKVVNGVQGKKCYYEVQQWGPGVVLRPAVNPNGKDLPDGILDAVLMTPGMPPIDAENWAAIQNLYVHVIENDPRAKGDKSFKVKFRVRGMPELEVSVIFCLAEDRSHWIVIVARQVVSKGGVAEDRTRGGINILTGERYTMIPPPGYIEWGTCHSHNTIRMPSFSGTDDANELHIGGWHILCSCYHKDKDGVWVYEITPSVCINGHRYQHKVVDGVIVPMVPEDMVDDSPRPDIVMHPDTMEYVSVEYPKDWDHAGFAALRYPHRMSEGALIPYDRQEMPVVDRTKRPFSFEVNYDEFMAYFNTVEDPKDFPGQIKMFDLYDDEEDDPRNDTGEHARLKRMLEQEMESILDCVDHMEMLVDDRRIVADIIAASFNKLEMWKKIKRRKNP